MDNNPESSFQSLLQSVLDEHLLSTDTQETSSQVEKRNNSDQMIECTFDSCKARCHTIGNLMKHLRKDHTTSTRNPSLCKICHKPPSSGQTLLTHYFECARINEASNHGKDNDDEISEEITTETARVMEINTHGDEPIECEEEDDPVNDHQENVVVDKDMFCCHCGIGFTDNTLYQFHRMFHSSLNPFHCANCGIELDDKYEFNAHLVLFSHGSQSV